MLRKFLSFIILGFPLISLISCTYNDLPVPVSRFQGIWKAVSNEEIPNKYFGFSVNDLSKNKTLIIKVNGDSIEIQGLYRKEVYNGVLRSTTTSDYPIIKALLTNNSISIRQEMIVNSFFPKLLITGKGSFTKDSLRLNLNFYESGFSDGSIITGDYTFLAKKICSDFTCTIFPDAFKETYTLNGVGWYRRYTFSNPPYVFSGPRARSENIAFTVNYPFEVYITYRDRYLTGYYLNDSLKIPYQFPMTGNGTTFAGNIVLKDGKVVSKIVNSYRADTYYDTLYSQ